MTESKHETELAPRVSQEAFSAEDVERRLRSEAASLPGAKCSPTIAQWRSRRALHRRLQIASGLAAALIVSAAMSGWALLGWSPSRGEDRSPRFSPQFASPAPATAPQAGPLSPSFPEPLVMVARNADGEIAWIGAPVVVMRQQGDQKEIVFTGLLAPPPATTAPPAPLRAWESLTSEEQRAVRDAIGWEAPPPDSI